MCEVKWCMCEVKWCSSATSVHYMHCSHENVSCTPHENVYCFLLNLFWFPQGQNKT